MRFRSSIKNTNTFIKLAASLNLLGKVAWVRLDRDQVRFTVVPEHGTQVWAVLQVETIFDDDYFIESIQGNNTINLEVPLAPLHRALKSAQNAISAHLRLTKKDNVPMLCLTIKVQSPLTSSGRPPGHLGLNDQPPSETSWGGGGGFDDIGGDAPTISGRSRETTITQDITMRVLAPSEVDGIHEPQCAEPEVHILLPPLLQLKSISERFTKLAVTSSATGKPGGSLQGGVAGPKLEVAANMHGEMRVGIKTDALRIESRWSGLSNPELDPSEVEGGEEGVKTHPSTRMREIEGEEGWAAVRVEGRDWGRVLGVGRLGGRVIACFCHDRALILYVYLSNDEEGVEDSVLTYYISCYSA